MREICRWLPDLAHFSRRRFVGAQIALGLVPHGFSGFFGCFSAVSKQAPPHNFLPLLLDRRLWPQKPLQFSRLFNQLHSCGLRRIHVESHRVLALGCIPRPLYQAVREIRLR